MGKNTKTVKNSRKEAGNKYFNLGTVSVVLLCVFILWAPKGYVGFDIYKRNCLYTITAVIGLWYAGANVGMHRDEKRTFDITAKLSAALFCVWIVGVFFSVAKYNAVVGDLYRSMGMFYLGSGLLLLCIFPKIKNIKTLTSKALCAVAVTETVIIVLQEMKIDIFGWTYGGSVSHLRGTLGNLDQNAIVCALLCAVLAVTYVTDKSEKINDRAVYLAGYGFAFLGGVASRADSFYLGAAAMMLVLGYMFMTKQEFRKKICDVLITSDTAFPLAFLIYRIAPYYDISRATKIMLKPAVFVSVFVFLAALRAVGSKVKFTVPSVRAIVILVIPVIAARAVFTAHSSRLLGEREAIWYYSKELYKLKGPVQKMVGVGINGFSAEIYIWFYNEINAIYGIQQTLADRHNMYLDMLISSGIAGLACWMGVIFTTLAKYISKAKEDSAAFTGISLILAYLAVSIFNSNLNVAYILFLSCAGIYLGEEKSE